jgi:hypothetical protein
MLDRLRSVLDSRYPRLVARVIAAVVCFALAIVLSVIPGPAFPFWILGLALLGVSVGQVLMSIHAIQEFLNRHVPYADRLPRLRKGHMKAILRHRWVRTLDRWTGYRENRRRQRAKRRAARAGERSEG